jgi:hypothetical protein
MVSTLSAFQEAPEHMTGRYMKKLTIQNLFDIIY